MKWNVALLQMDIAFGQPEKNVEAIRNFVNQLQSSDERPDVVLLPELWDTGYDLKRLDEIADKNGERAKQLLSDAAEKLQAHVIGGSVAENRDGRMYNTTFVFDRSGKLAGSYSKAHLFRLMEEEKFLAAGDRPGVYILDGQPVSSVICYDIRFPEWVRVHALQGARALFVCAQWPHPRLNHWRQLLISRAIENQMYVIACNRVGEGDGNTFCGHSMVINPWGEIIAEGMQQEEIIRAEIDLSLVDEVRSRIPVIADRRPDLYRL
ncbi:carbon-nitrogen family hydrolase [Brevibacillus borstelensis]|uniref:carbon-nitrogen family hydrolase n=1 Tax=Brevibacillus borstelensis TaxID=45462 RepID=UPI001490818D|nr:carbon-nitrogen family hydrolase [Brevibacillus borstelensis]MCM3470886.1 carbon-nitrogen family hydrolase [Brevibacillus borstelensis]MCM3559337.1 carbon-nitrogen family hydrolase [Brevibacillus borstelensis]MED1744716.1 carbon-nitrogen family hydrolase [Brevibacillus borstelensis]MED1853773.1 carbon-nitrogen family hydrolase [Brevibacillus borstelensis]NOU57290.1 carbon-nitrogen family hydrolase [Brevibacillus borstelensis]